MTKANSNKIKKILIEVKIKIMNKINKIVIIKLINNNKIKNNQKIENNNKLMIEMTIIKINSKTTYNHIKMIKIRMTNQ